MKSRALWKSIGLADEEGAVEAAGAFRYFRAALALEGHVRPALEGYLGHGYLKKAADFKAKKLEGPSKSSQMLNRGSLCGAACSASPDSDAAPGVRGARAQIGCKTRFDASNRTRARKDFPPP